MMRRWGNSSGWAAAVLGAATMGPAAESPGPSSRRTGLTISEVFLGGVPGSATEHLQWVEIYNSNPWPEAVGGYALGGDASFRLPDGAEVPASGYLVIASDPAALRDGYDLPAEAAVTGGWQGVLGTSEGTVVVEKSQGAVLLRVRYQNSDPWPAAAFGLGHSLALARPSFGEGQARAWEASLEPGGSPGGPEPVPGEEHLARGLRINELAFPASPGDGPAWVELLNASALSVPFLSLELVWGGSAAAGLPSRDSLDPGERAVVDLPVVFAEESARGGVLRLQERETGRVLLAVRVPVPVAGRTWGCSPDGSEFSGWLDGPTRAAPNPGFAPARVVINEIHYHPVSDDEAETFVELHNP
ncbi:MAG TPA: lamin tail domain-containing protein, partial [Verrucomicrobiales bacterium]|nr:lamin tail domain-containing protein [Verrucomicrobiales bacterium]